MTPPDRAAPMLIATAQDDKIHGLLGANRNLILRLSYGNSNVTKVCQLLFLSHN